VSFGVIRGQKDLRKFHRSCFSLAPDARSTL
jgi:hypothetical protein